MGKYRIEILQNGTVDILNLEGCKAIEKYTLEQITVSLSNRALTINGENLSMPVLVGGNLCVNGHIETLHFTFKEKK